MTICLPKSESAAALALAWSADSSFIATWDCCQANYTLESYATGNYILTGKCQGAPASTSILNDDAPLTGHFQKRFEVCGAKLSDDLKAPEEEKISISSPVVTMDDENTIGRTKSFSATFKWDLSTTEGDSIIAWP